MTAKPVLVPLIAIALALALAAPAMAGDYQVQMAETSDVFEGEMTGGLVPSTTAVMAATGDPSLYVECGELTLAQGTLTEHGGPSTPPAGSIDQLNWDECTLETAGSACTVTTNGTWAVTIEADDGVNPSEPKFVIHEPDVTIKCLGGIVTCDYSADVLEGRITDGTVSTPAVVTFGDDHDATLNNQFTLDSGALCPDPGEFDAALTVQAQVPTYQLRTNANSNAYTGTLTATQDGLAKLVDTTDDKTYFECKGAKLIATATTAGGATTHPQGTVDTLSNTICEHTPSGKAGCAMTGAGSPRSFSIIHFAMTAMFVMLNPTIVVDCGGGFTCTYTATTLNGARFVNPGANAKLIVNKATLFKASGVKDCPSVAEYSVTQDVIGDAGLNLIHLKVAVAGKKPGNVKVAAL